MSILFLQEMIIIPILLIALRKRIVGGIISLKNDLMAKITISIALFATPFSFLVLGKYGPSEVMMAITAGTLITGIWENSKALHISNKRAIIASIIAFCSILVILHG